MQISTFNGSNSGSSETGTSERTWARALARKSGDVIDLTRSGIDVEVVLGFRPGIDRLMLPIGQTLGFRQEGCDVVISRGSRGVIVLQGVTIAEMAGGADAG